MPKKKSARELKKADDDRRASQVAHETEHAPKGVDQSTFEEVTRYARQLKVRYSAKETRDQLALVEMWWSEGKDSTQIARVARRRWPEFSVARVKRLIERVKLSWAAEAEQRSVDDRREAARRRIMRIAESALGAVDQKTGFYPKANYQAVLRAEEMMMDIEGTRRPKKVELEAHGSFTQAMLHVIGGIDPDEASALLHESMEEERLAGMARALLPASVIGAESGIEVVASSKKE